MDKTQAKNDNQTPQAFEPFSQYKHSMGVLLNTFYWADSYGNGKVLLAERKIPGQAWDMVQLNGDADGWTKITIREFENTLTLSLNEKILKKL